MKYSDIDIFDINYVHTISYISKIVNKQSLIQTILSKSKRVKHIQNRKNVDDAVNVLFFGESFNNLRSFETICSNLKERYQIITSTGKYPHLFYLFGALPYIMTFINTYRKSDNGKRQLIRSHFITFFLTYGKLKKADKILSEYSPKLLVLANDHSPFNRALLKMALRKNIKTLYTQHASVSNEFPKLEFDYSMLDGMESYINYGKTSKKNSKVLLVGASRLDNFYQTSEYLEEKKIGISINEFDNFETIKRLCIYLQKSLNFKIIVRPHPSMGDWNKDWFLTNHIYFSDASKVPPSKYLSSLLVQISNVSGIHLDAVILKTPTIQYQLSVDPVSDIFNYGSSGLIKSAYSQDELLYYIKHLDLLIPKPDIVRHYLASYESPIEGSVGKFIASYINAIVASDVTLEYELETKHQIKTFIF